MPRLYGTEELLGPDQTQLVEEVVDVKAEEKCINTKDKTKVRMMRNW